MRWRAVPPGRSREPCLGRRSLLLCRGSVLLFLALGRRVRLWPGLVEALVDEVLDLFFLFFSRSADQQSSADASRGSCSPLSLLSISLPVSSKLESSQRAVSACAILAASRRPRRLAASRAISPILSGQATGRYGEIWGDMWGDMGRYKLDRLVDERHQRNERKANQRRQPIRRLQLASLHYSFHARLGLRRELASARPRRRP